ncbi:MAG: GH3 auxin-responsive promoter family protein [Saprospiraceae bacterium]|nr:GH3 auxin-responsive promoter family protein [Saprospiraceae bacterium]
MRTLVNKIFSKYLEYRMEANRHFMASPHDTQQRVLMELVEAHADTEWGRLHRFDQINSPADYARQVPVQTYGSLQPYIERMMRGEVDVLYTGFVEWFAKSSGTTGGGSKYLPSLRKASWKTTSKVPGTPSPSSTTTTPTAMFLPINRW